MSKLVRYISCYSKSDDMLIKEYYLPDNIDISLLRDIFDINQDYEIYQSYNIKTKKQISEINKYLIEAIDTSKYDYFLESYIKE